MRLFLCCAWLLLWAATGDLLITFVGYLALMAALQSIAAPFVNRLEVLRDISWPCTP